MTLKKLDLVELNAQEMKETEGGNPWLVVAIIVVAVVAYYEANRNGRDK
ncbi:class IIb bacteriocin, lactobin A/cerein 7B family [Elizabethkingia bruuniana]|uniref:Class IIb bacteriocin, lactobin A/cerein 7B family n=1 Tax=Elizabethkingia bruuniana TaxID=1756149 RepID=A0A7T7V2U3_9FLAO|nr:class IIb bacteriocin, lactobin A/cerein 7B family [Elizabethkingia bruuniana]QDZ63811.1 class IIb bacteriocin, lactobin A/cerein 7B family [Elizabethkingia bruuniana]QQN60812.1 class IIb bacteriocin, lactobin A/cerein 7B family [Elizabethkingia bruuniana]